MLALGKTSRKPADLIRAATILLRFVRRPKPLRTPQNKNPSTYRSGGGAKNPLVVAQLSAACRIEIIPSSRFGIPADAKEAFAFAPLAYDLPSPSVSHASRRPRHSR
jgi:1,6-anhydro-N-acetylmuramate kinase